jgi:ribonucleoside-diphosphate reductase alpha chain
MAAALALIPAAYTAGDSRLSGNAQRVLAARYLRRNSAGQIHETPEELFQRVARAVAEAELLHTHARDAATWETRYLEALLALDFLPNSPTLMNAGTALGQLSACFLLPIEDSMEGIFDSLRLMALVQRSAGGTGFSFSQLRPKGSLVASTGGAASGPVSFMRIFDTATENIQLGGRRRGANMAVLRVDHPDILDFVKAKREGASFSTFNLSVGVTDAFMQAVRDGMAYDLVHPASGRSLGRQSAPDVFDAIVDGAWATGDPGMLFIDAINRANPVPHLGAIDATNPCGEVPLLPYESCDLGSINVAHMLTDRGTTPRVDWRRLAQTAALATRFLDDVIDVGQYPDDRFAHAARQTRKIGLGVMGFAELLVRLEVPYGTPAALHLAERIMWCIRRAARRTSAALANERGAYPAWRPDALHNSLGPQRNATVTAIAPTGTIGIIADTTASIEPLFALAYRRSHVLGNQTLVEVPRVVRDLLARYGADVDAVVAGNDLGALPVTSLLPEHIRNVLVTALEITPEQHLQTQAAFQRHTDNSVSKTVNLPATAGRDSVAKVFQRAWELGLKGVTVYRYGSKPLQVLELAAGQEAFHVEHAARCDPTECRL